MKVLWVARYRNEYVEVSGGHKMVGFCGWHTDAVSALDEAARRYPDVAVADMYVARV